MIKIDSVINESKKIKSYCFLDSPEGFRQVCLVGGEKYCVFPLEPQACTYRILDEEIIQSDDGHLALLLLVKRHPPELHYYLFTLDGRPLHQEPFLSRSAALEKAQEYFASKSSMVKNILSEKG